LALLEESSEKQAHEERDQQSEIQIIGLTSHRLTDLPKGEERQTVYALRQAMATGAWAHLPQEQLKCHALEQSRKIAVSQYPIEG
jgi:hypothetical protein